MSTNIDRIFGLVDNIINDSKTQNLILAELDDLLKNLKNMKGTDGLKLFIDAIDSRSTFEKEKVIRFLLKFVSDLSLYPSLFNYITAEKIKIPSLKEVLKEEKEEELTDFDELAEKPQISVEKLSESKSKNIERDTVTTDDSLARQKIFDEEPNREIAQPSKDSVALEPKGESIVSRPGSGKNQFQPSPAVPAGKPSPPGSQPSPAPNSTTMTTPSPTIMPLPPSPPQQEKRSAEVKESRKKTAEEKTKGKESKKMMARGPTASAKAELKDSSGMFNSLGTTQNEEKESELTETGRRGVLIDYYSRMNINQVYDFTVKIDKEVLLAKKKRTDLLTGEQREQLADEITVVEELPIEVELHVPGCLVSPSTQYVSPKVQTSQVTFYVTPYVKFSKRDANLTIGQTKLDKKTLSFKVSVIDRRIMKILSFIGVMIPAIPSVWPYLFGVNMNQQLTTSAKFYMPLMTTDFMLGIELVLGTLLTGSSLATFKMYSSKRSSFTSTQML